MSVLFVHAEKLADPREIEGSVTREGRVKSNTSERATTKEKKGRNLEITRPNDKKTVEEGKGDRLVSVGRREASAGRSRRRRAVAAEGSGAGCKDKSVT